MTRRVLAIARLTFQEGIRMRIVLVFLLILVILVLRMPFALSGDDTLTGRLQNFLAYSIGALGVLMSLATIFFSCATLSTELRERSLHLLVTKPVSRFEILLGKWVGVNLLNVLIVVLCGGAIYGLAYYIQARPEHFEQDRVKLRDTVWTARAGVAPIVPKKELAELAEEATREAVRTGRIPESQRAEFIQTQFTELLARWYSVGPGESRLYRFEGLAAPDSGTVFQVRYKIRAQPLTVDEMVTVAFAFCDPDTHAPLEQPTLLTERSNATHQFLARAGPAIKNGTVELLVMNPMLYLEGKHVALVFEGNDSLQVFYRVGGFEWNFVRALLLILLRLALLSALGVFFSVFVSFPVACLCTASFYLVCLGLPFWLESMGAFDPDMPANIDPYGRFGPVVRKIFVPVISAVFPDFTKFDGAGPLVDGQYIRNSVLLLGGLRTLVYGAVLLLLPGYLIFRVREVAEVQV